MALAASLIAFAAADAQALSLKLKDLSLTPVADVTVSDDDNDGAISFGGAFGDFALTGVFGTSASYPPSASLFAQFSAFSTGGASAQLELSDTGFTLGGTDKLANFFTGLTANLVAPLNGSVTIESFVDASDALYGRGTLLGSVTGTSGAKSAMFTNLLDIDEPFSLTHVITITHNSGGTSNGDATTSVAPVPLPAAAWMLAGALGGLGALSRKRRKA